MMNGGDHGVNGVNGGTNQWPNDIGIIDMEIYFPSQYVEQSEYETFKGVSAGKFTIGLGQTRMGFCSDREDAASLCLTVVDKLMSRTGTSYANIGRMDVGTESLIDKSKSIKTVLMQLFSGSGNSDVEGVDSTNACYGGTAALFNSINWIESSAWDGRLALAVCADIAAYADGPARPTGGAGAVAMLIGPNAGLVLERGLRASHFDHGYDFYKPNLSSPYPTVDGPLSVKCYLQALDKSYGLYKQKSLNQNAKKVDLSTFDAFLFHTPYCKLVQKSLARLAFNDFKANPDVFPQSLQSSFAQVELEDSYFNRDVEKSFLEVSKTTFEAKTVPSLMIAKNVGNMYTPSLYGGLVSFIVSHETAESLVGKRVALFSYGSGCASTFFSVKVKDRAAALHQQLKANVLSRLKARTKISPEEYTKTMQLREDTHNKAPYQPVGLIEDLFPATWYLENIDEKYCRKYLKTPTDSKQSTLIDQ